MELTHIPKLEHDKIGMWNEMGWYLDKHEQFPSKEIVIFQCQFGHGARVTAEFAIGRDGKVSPVMQCHCLKFKESVILDDWPDWWYKLLGKEEVVKYYDQASDVVK